MTKYRLKKNTITYKGKMLNPGDILELDVFDNTLPTNWFEKIEEPKPLPKETETEIETENTEPEYKPKKRKGGFR